MSVLALERLVAPAIPNVTLVEFVLGDATKHGDRRALVDAVSGRALSYSRLASLVRQSAGGLAIRGVRKGDVLGLCAPNSIEFIVAFYAASSVGAVVTTVNPQWTDEEISRQLAQAGARWLATTREVAAKVSGIEIICVEDFAVRSPHGAALLPSLDLGPDDVAFLPSSSGTTGLPKSVVLTHRNLVASLCQTQPVLNAGDEDVVLAVLPLFHIFGLQVSLNLALRAGATVVIVSRFELQAAAERA